MTTDRTAVHSWLVGLMLLAAALLAGCSVMSKGDCEKADWHELGRRDAEQGYEATPRYTQRAQACSKAGVNVNNPEYFTGHALGQTNYCTVARGREAALAGLPPSGACQIETAVRAYRSGYDDGLKSFCTAKSGFDFGRHGFTYRNTCPPESVNAFQGGYRLGSELKELNRRLEGINSQRADERKVLADAKSTAGDRDRANRRLGQLDGDEAAVRQMIRQAELNALSLTQPAAQPPAANAPAGGPPTRALAAELVVGQWEITSKRFSFPVDLNRDGVKSAEALDEHTACQRDQRFEIGADRKSTLRIGANTPGCKPVTETYGWQVGDAKVRSSRYEKGRRIVDERPAVLLRLRNARSSEVTDMIVESISADAMTVRTELPDGGDSSSEAVLTYRRARP